MSLDISLKTKGKLARVRNVLTRNERLLALEREGRWNPEADSPYGLPKVKVLKVKKRVKEKKEKEGEEPSADTAEPSSE